MAARTIQVAALQLACSWDLAANLDNAERMVRAAAAQGAQLILLPEFFATPYFCIEQQPGYFELAQPAQDSPILRRFAALSGELGVVLPLSFFERHQHSYFNSLAMAEAGELLGIYRKSHIPDGPGYQEKYYFSPGDTGFRVWDTRLGRIGVGICWDQWFPESARVMALSGAELLCYPTAIGSEPPPAPPVDSRRHWQRVQQGHAAANLMPLVAANRVGTEQAQHLPGTHIRFYGSSFIADAQGALLAEANDTENTILQAQFDLDALRRQRDAWFLFRDRRPELYGVIGSHGAPSEGGFAK
ncbi:MAG: N-carbamoylputrescine amidase [Steroidobacteraceae bacterium]